MENPKHWEGINRLIETSVIPTHITKKEAQEAAKSIGWPVNYVVRFERRFELVWVVADMNNLFDTMNLPTFKRNDDGSMRTVPLNKTA